MEINLTDINSEFLSCIKDGTVGTRPIDALLLDDRFAPKEGWFWDYKKAYPSERIGIAKIVLAIVSFHNSYGGYLLFGIDEVEKDKTFIPCGIESAHFDQAQLREAIKNYTGENIEFNAGFVSKQIDSNSFQFLIIQIPKRTPDKQPISFVKNGPESSPNKLLFKPDDVFHRKLDECLKVTKKEDWANLYTPRDFSSVLNNSSDAKKASPLEHNLPDQQLICSEFIGRDSHIASLWEWLSDEFEYTKILAGDGGKGKTSIAFEFCKEFVNAAPHGFYRVLWLSAKEKQFSAEQNEYFDLQDADFSDLKSFLTTLAENCTLKTDEYSNISNSLIKKQLKSVLRILPSLIVVDDVDSLDEEDQRSIVDTCRQLGEPNVRFLITTRKRFSYSNELCIEVRGLEESDYSLFVEGLSKKYKIRKPNSRDLSKLLAVTDGSPLLTQSILRFVRLGDDLNQTIDYWKSGAGEDARNAALQKEIDGLSVNAKRMLLAVSYFGSCSFSELRKVMGMEAQRFSDSIEELQSLFLVDEPRIIEKEPRVSVSSTTALVVKTRKTGLAYDHSKLEKAVKELRSSASSAKKRGNRQRVGLTISQSLALLHENNHNDALLTVENELRHQPKNSDLLLMKARVLSAFEKPDYSKICTILRESVKRGQTKELAFQLWFEAEERTKDPNGMIEVAEQAISTKDVYKKYPWHYKLARSFVLKSNHREGTYEIDDLMEASKNLSIAIQGANGADKERTVQEARELNDLIWARVQRSDDYTWLTAFDFVFKLLEQGDLRTAMFIRAHKCLSNAIAEGMTNELKRKAYYLCVGKLKKIIENRHPADIADRPFHDLLESLAHDF